MKRLIVVDPQNEAMVWKLHPTFIVWCGGEFDIQPQLLQVKKNHRTMEEYLEVIPIGEKLTSLDPKRVFNTDEKPCVLAQIDPQTIVFPSKTAPCFVPQQAREANCTLIITTRGDGLLAAVTIIFPSLALNNFEAVKSRLESLHAAVTVTTSPSGLKSFFIQFLFGSLSIFKSML